MKTTTYKCNLCLEVKNKSELLSMYWKSDKIPQGYVIHDNVSKSDKHICVGCIDVIKNGYKD